MITNVIVFIAGTLLGGLITHYFAIGRDKRKELNESADILYHSLIKFRGDIENGGYGIEPTSNEFDDLKRRLPFYKTNRFEKAIIKYQKAISQENRYRDFNGEPHIKNSQIIISAIDKLLKFTKRK